MTVAAERPPQIKRSPRSNMYFESGYPIALSCDATGLPPPRSVSTLHCCGPCPHSIVVVHGPQPSVEDHCVLQIIVNYLQNRRNAIEPSSNTYNYK